MPRPFASVILFAIFSIGTFGQSTGQSAQSSGQAAGQAADTTVAESSTRFEIADVHTSAAVKYPYMNGGDLHADRYIIRDATIIDLINTAYGVDEDNIFGGAAWTEIDRFDVIAQAAPGSSPDALKLMLQNLLADRFKLVVHKDTKPVLGYVLSAPRGKGNLKGADPSEKSGCDPQQQTPAPETVPFIMASCHNMTTGAMADALHDMAGGYIFSPVKDATGLEGGWDFTLSFSGAGQLQNGPPPATAPGSGGLAVAAEPTGALSLFDAVSKQMGLKLVKEVRPAPVLVIDSVSEQPTDN